MAEQLYALQRDLEMVAIQANNLTRALSDLDLILHRLVKLEIEVSCIGVQLGRLEERTTKIEQRLDRFEQRSEKLLLLICKKLDINPDAA